MNRNPKALDALRFLTGKRNSPEEDYKNESFLHHFAVNVAGRLSIYEEMPSLASSLWKRICWTSRSSANPDSRGISHPLCTARLMRPTAFAALFGGQNWRAYSITLD